MSYISLLYYVHTKFLKNKKVNKKVFCNIFKYTKKI